LSKKSYIEVDGSFGEGGGQILRTSIAISSVLKKPVKIINIRSKRSNPGLRPQHVASIKILSEICGAHVENLGVGSTSIIFEPGNKVKNNIKFNIGTAGSLTLLSISSIPVICLKGEECLMELVGGTDVKWSPTIDYFKYVVLPAYKLIGIECKLEIIKRGYYPRGGGKISINIKPNRNLKSLKMLATPRKDPSGISICSNLPRSVAERQMKTAMEYFRDNQISFDKVVIDFFESYSPGSSILLYSVGDKGPFLGADSLGERGKSAESVGREAAIDFIEEYRTGAPIDRHLGDILIAPLFLAEGESRFRVTSITQHLTTDLFIASYLTGKKYSIDNNIDGTVTVSIGS